MEQKDIGLLLEEIECVLRRNQNEEYLHHLLNCALAYEKALSH